MRRILRAGFRLVLVLLVLAGGAGLWGWREYTRVSQSEDAHTVIIQRGSGVQAIGRQLEQAGIVRNAFLFTVAARLTDQHRRLQAGEYHFPPAMTLEAVIDKLARGDRVVRRITVAEGLTVHEVLERLAETEGLAGAVPEKAEEGSLLPDTYHFTWGDSRAEMAARMRSAMDEALQRAWDARKPGLPLASPEEMLILASIVEKETGVAAERPRVAAVFLNRLERGMKLQSDPTVVYAIARGTGPLDRALTREDLRIDSPYNTYQVAGLPPTPIANPGMAALEAVASPAATEDLYFVADGSGGHAFARTLDEHNRNVARWRRIEQKRNGE